MPPSSSPRRRSPDNWHVSERAYLHTVESPRSSRATESPRATQSPQATAAPLGDECPSASQASQTSQTSTGSQTSQRRSLRRRGAGTGAWNVPGPVSLTETSAQTFGFKPKDADKRNERLADEMRSLCVGPMPVEEFLIAFLSASDVSFEHMPPSPGAFDRVPSVEGIQEKDIYIPLIETLNAEGERGSRCPGFVFRDTSTHPDTSGGVLGAKKPDVCCYADRDLAAVHAQGDLQSRTDMGLATTFFEIKVDASKDPFSDPPPGASRAVLETWCFVFGKLTGSDLEHARRDFGQIIAYASEISMRQYRHCIYSVMLCGTRARLMRWDRAGVIITESFDIRQSPDLLCRFFWCFASVSDADRGYDLTVEPATAEDEKLFERVILKHLEKQLPHADYITQRMARFQHHSPSSVTSIYVPREEGDEEVLYQYLVSRPIVAPLSAIGRGTRGHWAVDVKKEAVVFLKDTWRHGEREGLIIEALHAAGVEHIPPVEYHNDVPMATFRLDDEEDVVYTEHGNPQVTRTQDFIKSNWVCGTVKDLRRNIVRRTRYRLVLSYAGHTLMDCRGTSELLHGAYDAFKALRDAYVRCGYHHRDVTPANIILYHDGTRERDDPRKGYLVDWDLSCHSMVVGDVQRRHAASMSWQFRSIRVAEGKTDYSVQDDMESFYYVVLYCGLLYIRHYLKTEQFTACMDAFFDWHSLLDNKIGGAIKSANLFGVAWAPAIEWRCKAMRDWLESTRCFIKDYIIGSRSSTVDWAPEPFADWWHKFLEAPPHGSLSTTDRCDFLSKNREHLSKIAPRGPLGPFYQPTIALPAEIIIASSRTASTTPSARSGGQPAHPSSEYAITNPRLWNMPRSLDNDSARSTLSASLPSLPVTSLGSIAGTYPSTQISLTLNAASMDLTQPQGNSVIAMSSGVGRVTDTLPTTGMAAPLPDQYAALPSSSTATAGPSTNNGQGDHAAPDTRKANKRKPSRIAQESPGKKARKSDADEELPPSNLT